MSYACIFFAEHEDGHTYAICCKHGEKLLYFNIKKNSNQVVADTVDNLGGINFFNLLSTEKPDEFIIVDYVQLEVETLRVINRRHYDFWPTPRYLKVKTHLGYNRGPLCLEDSVDEYYCRLKVRPRLYRKKRSVTLNDFANGKDTYYICTAVRHGKTGYLYLRDRGEREEERVNTRTRAQNGLSEIELGSVRNDSNVSDSSMRARYVTACKPSIKMGSEDELMLFRLVRYESTYVPKKLFKKTN